MNDGGPEISNERKDVRREMGQREILIHGKGIYDSDKRCMDGTGLVICDGKIIERGEFHKLAARCSGARVLDYSQEYILPGLINTHVHLEFTPSDDSYAVYMGEDHTQHLRKAIAHGEALLRSGVTTARDLGSSIDLVKSLKQGQPAGINLPRLQLSGPPLTERRGHLAFLGMPADSEEELIKGVQERSAAGCGCIKIIASGGQSTPGSCPEQNAYDRDRIQAAAEAAHNLGLPTAAHCLTTTAFVNSMFGGVDCIEHCACFVRKQPENLLAREYVPEIMEMFRDDGRQFMVGISNHYHRLDDVREGRRRPSFEESFWLDQEKRECEIVQHLLELGMRPVIGTDSGFGQTYFEETWLEVALLKERCGLSESEVIHAATAAGAEALGMGNQLGKLKAGYEADFITVPENPLKQIRAFRQVKHVMRQGELIV